MARSKSTWSGIQTGDEYRPRIVCSSGGCHKHFVTRGAKAPSQNTVHVSAIHVIVFFNGHCQLGPVRARIRPPRLSSPRPRPPCIRYPLPTHEAPHQACRLSTFMRRYECVRWLKFLNSCMKMSSIQEKNSWPFVTEKIKGRRLISVYEGAKTWLQGNQAELGYKSEANFDLEQDSESRIGISALHPNSSTLHRLLLMVFRNAANIRWKNAEGLVLQTISIITRCILKFPSTICSNFVWFLTRKIGRRANTTAYFSFTVLRHPKDLSRGTKSRHHITSDLMNGKAKKG